eukprot:TRINITY_DN3803_c0_g1_i2.p1 TRINITY_DN3803_c0_g1~~TRINITY_DN3803_c0_g1_i2.p1  ORF type:complete len:652 (+),score=232.46 TRINITY_DN3803_c0_g1_i2:129-2084(+)
MTAVLIPPSTSPHPRPSELSPEAIAKAKLDQQEDAGRVLEDNKSLNGQLTVDAEGILKKILFQEIFRRELQKFAQTKDPQSFLDGETVLLGFLFKTLLGDHPNHAVQELIFNTPKIVSIVAKATRKRDSTSSLFSAIMDMILRTPKEKKYALETGGSKRFAQLVEDNINVRKADGVGETTYQSLLSGRKQVINALVSMFDDVNNRKEGTDYLFDVFMNTHKISELPKEYQGMFDAMTTAILPSVCEDIQDPEQVDLRKNMFHNFPRRTLYTLLTMTNPFKMASSLASLFFAKPLGSRNVAQKLMETATEISKTQQKLEKSRQSIHPNYQCVCDHIERWASLCYDPLESTYNDDTMEEAIVHGIDHNKGTIDSSEEEKLSVKRAKLYEVLGRVPEKEQSGHSYTSRLFSHFSYSEKECPKAEVLELVNKMGDQDLSDILVFFLIAKRLKDKQSVVELFGDAQVIDILKAIFPMICSPLSDIYSSVGIPTYLHDNFQWLKAIFTIGEDHKMNQEEKRDALHSALLEFEENQFRLIHNLAKADRKSNVLKKVFDWTFQKFKIGDGMTLDIQPLFDSLSESAKREVEEELSKVIRFEQYKNQLWKVDFEKAGQLERPKSPAVIKHLTDPLYRLLQVDLKGLDPTKKAKVSFGDLD